MPPMPTSATVRILDAERHDRFRILLLPRAPYEAAYVASEGLIRFAFESQSGFCTGAVGIFSDVAVLPGETRMGCARKSVGTPR